MTRTGWTLGALGGGLIAGLGITALTVAGEHRNDTASELTMLGRDSARRFGIDAPRSTRLPGSGEQAIVQGGHLALSALAGAAYATTFDKGVPVAVSGVAFGLAFYVLAHVVTGPILGVKAPEWRQPRGTIPRHMVNHAMFGLVTALGARLGACTCQ